MVGDLRLRLEGLWRRVQSLEFWAFGLVIQGRLDGRCSGLLVGAWDRAHVAQSFRRTKGSCYPHEGAQVRSCGTFFSSGCLDWTGLGS